MTDFGGSIKKSQKYDLGILGIPFDEKSSYLKGTSQGPQAIRNASTGEAMNSWTELGVSLRKDTVVTDLGDLDVSGTFWKVFQRIEEKVLEILDNSAVPLILGGDHSITYPIMKAFSRKYQFLDILHFDAHPDLYEELDGDRFSHACPFARIMEEHLAQNVVQVGIRTINRHQKETAEKYGVRMIEMKSFKDNLSLKFDNPLYISFDMDALDPAFAPGVSHHEAGGLSTRQVIDILHILNAEIVGLDVVELNPSRDGLGITASAAVKIIMEIAGKIVFSRKNE
ncbi:MAG: agmatinase [Candidatus Aminicenantaceae bacterium]